jgi:hypothetical protein
MNQHGGELAKIHKENSAGRAGTLAAL